MRLSLTAVIARLLLSAVLLAGWQAALQHPIEHVDELGEFVHVDGGHSHEGSDAGPLCDLLASLTACASGTAILAVGAERFASLPPSTTHGAPRVAEAPPFFSQGPPSASV
jgi:hypothetical protein